MLVTLNEVLRRRLGHKRFSTLYPHFIQQHIVPGAISELRRELGRVSNFN